MLHIYLFETDYYIEKNSNYLCVTRNDFTVILIQNLPPSCQTFYVHLRIEILAKSFVKLNNKFYFNFFIVSRFHNRSAV